MSTTVYVAASSADIDRAERWATAVRDAGITVVSTWIETIRNVGSANPRDAGKQERREWSDTDLDQVRIADVFWLLVPPLDLPTRGAWIEMGWALAGRQHVVCSGDTAQSIFCALGSEYATDEDAFRAICQLRDFDARVRNLKIGGSP